MYPTEEKIEFLKCELEHLQRCMRHHKQFIPMLVPGMPDHVGKTPEQIMEMIDNLMAQ